MVAYSDIQASNLLTGHTTVPTVSVFVGGTSGIGNLTIKALVATGATLRVYLVGRQSSRERMEAYIQALHVINPNADVVWVEGEVSLLAETKRVCEIIKAKEKRIDLLFLTTGYTPFGPRSETSEGLEISQSLCYYSRMLFILHLLPLLAEAESPRVISVLGAGMERTGVNVDDLDMKMPGNFGSFNAVTRYATMNTMALEVLASQHPNVTFIHSWPGWVNTGNVNRGNPNWLMGWFVRLVLEPLISLFSFSDAESAQRHLFQITSAAFGGRGVPWKGKPGINTRGTTANGLFLVNYKCDCSTNVKVLKALRLEAQDRIWNHTKGTIQPYL